MLHPPSVIRHLSFVILLALLIAGCATVGPDFQPPTPEAPADFTQWHGGSSELLAQRPTSTAPVPDWAQLRDPALDQLLARAIEANADVQTTALRLAESRALRQSASAGYQPQLNASAAMTRQRLSEHGDSSRMVTMMVPAAQQAQALAALASPYESDQAGLDFSWEIDLWGRVRRGIEATDAQVTASQALLAQARWSVQAEVARLYFQLRGIQRQLALTRGDMAAAEESLALVRARADGGLVSDLDVTRQQALLADLRARWPQLLAQEAAAANALTLLLAQPPGALQALLAAREDESPAEPSAPCPSGGGEERGGRAAVKLSAAPSSPQPSPTSLSRKPLSPCGRGVGERGPSNRRAASAPLPSPLPQGEREPNALLRQPPTGGEGAQSPLRQAPWPDLSLGLPSDVARRRPDIARAEAQLHAATASTGVAVADFYPRLTLGAHFGLAALSGNDFGAWGNRMWSIGPSLQLPIFDQGRRRATFTVRRLQQQEAAIAYHQSVLQAWHEIDNALNAYSAERQRNARLIEKERSSRDALTLAQANYENGRTDFLTQLDAQRSLIAAQRERADSDTQLGIGWSAVIKALGPGKMTDDQ